jgi:KDO2-lipid IV(A) lauroyltransferase
MRLLLHLLDKLVAFCLQYVLRYRLKIIRANLSDSFNYPTPQALDDDVKAFYSYLARNMRHIFSKPTSKTLAGHFQLFSNTLLDQYLAEGKSVIMDMGHVGNWEWTGSYLGMKYPGQVCAIYKKIKTSWFNQLMYNRRSTHVDHLIEIKKIGDLLRLIKIKPVLILMISDQNPGSDQGLIWVPFLNRNTAFVNGPENLAKRYQLPVVYINTTPDQPGGYQLICQSLYNGTDVVEPGEITRRYANALEQNIHECRPYWLWSHKRWKRTISS